MAFFLGDLVHEASFGTRSIVFFYLQVSIGSFLRLAVVLLQSLLRLKLVRSRHLQSFDYNVVTKKIIKRKYGSYMRICVMPNIVYSIFMRVKCVFVRDACMFVRDVFQSVIGMMRHVFSCFSV